MVCRGHKLLHSLKQCLRDVRAKPLTLPPNGKIVQDGEGTRLVSEKLVSSFSSSEEYDCNLIKIYTYIYLDLCVISLHIWFFKVGESAKILRNHTALQLLI